MTIWKRDDEWRLSAPVFGVFIYYWMPNLAVGCVPMLAVTAVGAPKIVVLPVLAVSVGLFPLLNVATQCWWTRMDADNSQIFGRSLFREWVWTEVQFSAVRPYRKNGAFDVLVFSSNGRTIRVPGAKAFGIDRSF